jgi:hypothetical protein
MENGPSTSLASFEAEKNQGNLIPKTEYGPAGDSDLSRLLLTRTSFHFRSRENQENLKLCLARASLLHFDPVPSSSSNFGVPVDTCKALSSTDNRTRIDFCLKVINLAKWNDITSLLH